MTWWGLELWGLGVPHPTPLGECGEQYCQAPVTALPLPGHVTLGKSLNYPRPWFLHKLRGKHRATMRLIEVSQAQGGQARAQQRG